MKREKIHNARLYVYCFLGCIGLGFLFKTLLQDNNSPLMQPMMIICGIAGVSFMLCASLSSRCPYCNEYLTFKRNWVGKYCKHCGKKIEKPTIK